MRRLLFALVVLATGSPRVASAGGDPTFTRDVAPIVQRHCQECHRAGGGGPFHLITYDQVYRRRAKILETTRTRTMPPWKPVAGYGDFLGVRGLSKDEIATIARWVETGAAEGDPGDLPSRPVSLIAIHPHMHLLGREMKVWAKLPNESTRPLVHIDDWDFNWQGFYFYRTPVPLPRAAWIELTAAWDNSAGNSRNPNRPPKPVQWGERTVDEMGHAAILYTLDDEKLDPRPR